MKKSMRRLVALMLALMLALGTSALAAGTASNTVHVNAQPKPEGQETEPAGETESTGTESAEAGDLEEPVDPDQSETEVADDAEEPEVQTHIVELQDGYLNVRAEPSMEGAIIGSLNKGDQVEVIAMEGDWARIRFGDAEAYVFAAYLVSGEPEPEQPAEPEAPAEGEQTEVPTEPEAPEAPAEPQPGQIPFSPEEVLPAEPEEQPDEPEAEPAEPSEEEPAEPSEEEPAEDTNNNEEIPAEPIGEKLVNTDSVYIRAEASASSEILGAAVLGDKVAVLSVEGDWMKVRAADGLEGYIYASYLSDELDLPAEDEQKPAEEPEAPSNDAEAAEPSEEEEAAPVVISYERDELTGELILDEDGNPIPVIPEGATEKPVAWLRDEVTGELILDEDGNPIVVQTLPIEAEKIKTEEDESNPARSIAIYINWVEQAEQHYYGDEAVLTAVLTGYDGLEYNCQWQTSKDGSAYADVEGATESTYVFPVTEENFYDYWRVEVTITGVIE